jgi:hypothetical protein
MGCASVDERSVGAEIFTKNELPSSIREIKRIKVFADKRKSETGLSLVNGELVSIMADGEIFRFVTLKGADHPGETVAQKPLIWWINDKNYGTIFWKSFGRTLISPASGDMQVGLFDDWHDDNKGHFDVIFVRWRTNNFAIIAETLEKIQEKLPDHRGVKDASQQANAYRNLAMDRVRTTNEIDATKEEIDTLKSKRRENGSGEARLSGKEQELEDRLKDLTSKLSQLDDLNRKLDEERKRSEELSRELEDREQREKELMSQITSPGSIPPVMLISTPEDGQDTEIGQIRLSGVVEDDRGVMQVEAFLNGIPTNPLSARGIHKAEAGAPLRLNFTQSLSLNKGENQIKVVATDIDGRSITKHLTVFYNDIRSNVWAVAVGINNYPELPKLKYAVNDANAFYKLLVDDNKIPPENVRLLLNEQANLKNLRFTLGTHLKRVAGTNDMVIIYFAGHGATERDAGSPDGDGLEKYLLAYDTDPSDLFSSAMPMRDIAHIFNRIRSERLVLIVDACYSGASGGRTFSIGGIRANLSDNFFNRIASGRGKIIISASAANEVSVEKDELGHGVFTYYLMEGLRGKADSDRDGMVTVDEAYRFVFEQVPKATAQEQHPVKKGSVEGTLVLSIVK